jgi:hypothetical protein
MCVTPGRFAAFFQEHDIKKGKAIPVTGLEGP